MLQIPTSNNILILAFTHHEPSHVAGLLALVVDRRDPRMSRGDRVMHDSPVWRAEPIASVLDQRKCLQNNAKLQGKDSQCGSSSSSSSSSRTIVKADESALLYAVCTTSTPGKRRQERSVRATTDATIRDGTHTTQKTTHHAETARLASGRPPAATKTKQRVEHGRTTTNDAVESSEKYRMHT